MSLETDYLLVLHLWESHAVFEELRNHHEQGSIYSQMLLLLKLSDMQFEPATPKPFANEVAVHMHREDGTH